MLKAMEGGQVFGGFASKAWVDKGEVREEVWMCSACVRGGERGLVCMCVSIRLFLSVSKIEQERP